MPIVLNKVLEVKVSPDCLISLLIKEFLRREALASEGRLKAWLRAVDQVPVGDWGNWALLTKRVVLKVMAKDFCATLKRRLTEMESHILAANVSEFVEIYGKSRTEVLKFKTQKGDSSC